MSAGANIVHETTHAAVATWRQVVVVAYRDRISVEVILAAVDATNRLALEMPTCLLTVFGERAQMPEPEAIRASLKALQDARSVCCARVILGKGLLPSALRGLLDANQRNSGDKRPQAQFTTIQEATSWLGHTMGKSALWRQQLTTFSGTLLYGSPSFSRHSQVAPYLAGEDVSGGDTHSDPPDKPRRG